MKKTFKNKYLYIFLSILFSLFLHMFLFVVLLKVSFKSDIWNVSPTKQSIHLKIIKNPSDQNKSLIDKSDIKQPEIKKTQDSPDMHVDMQPQFSPDNLNLKKNSVNTNYDIPQIKDTPLIGKNLKLPKIVSVDANSLPLDRIKLNRPFIPKFERESGIDNYGMLIPEEKKKVIINPIKMRVTLPPEKLPADSIPAKSLPNTPETRLIPEIPVVEMDPFIDVEIFKYPSPGGGGFFRIDLSPNKKAAALKNFHKDVIFLVDISGSIGRRRLAEFKLGLKNSLYKLKNDDRMNIVAFKSNRLPLFSSLSYPNKSNLKAANSFLFRLSDGGTTNVYSALAPYVGKKNRIPSRPLIIFLMSDGQVNSGEVVGNRDLINAISNKNHESAGIYSYSSGDDRNSFLMDLLSYRNRGESLYIPEIKGSSIALTSFIDAVSDVKVADLEYQISSDLADSAFPKRLPNLYRGKTLSVFGRYYRDSDSIGLRVTGRDSFGEIREIVIGGNLADAKLASESLPRKWAMQYIYHLYSLLSVKYDEKVKEAINETALRYRLKLPYLDTHLVPKKKNYVR